MWSNKSNDLHQLPTGAETFPLYIYIYFSKHMTSFHVKHKFLQQPELVCCEILILDHKAASLLLSFDFWMAEASLFPFFHATNKGWLRQKLLTTSTACLSIIKCHYWSYTVSERYSIQWLAKNIICIWFRSFKILQKHCLPCVFTQHILWCPHTAAISLCVSGGDMMIDDMSQKKKKIWL